MLGFCKCAFSAALGNHFQVQLHTYLKTAPCRTLHLKASVEEASQKVHKLKHTSTSVTPPWQKLIPFKGWRSKLENKRKPGVAVLNLHGLIAADMGRGGGGFGGKKPLNIGSTRKLIEKSFEVPRLEAVLLNINSPGGSPAQSELICEYIQLLASEKRVNVYSFVEDCAASGGYWLACAGERIYITENSVVGSIGVISASFGFQDAIKHLNIERRVQTAGTRKLINDPFAPQKQEDLEFTGRVLDKIHTNFKNHVLKNRGERVKGQNLDTLFSGEYWVGREAIELGLVDDVGTTDTFVRKEFGGPEKVNVVEMKSPVSKFQQLLGTSVNAIDWSSHSSAEYILMHMLQKGGTLDNPSLPHIRCKL